MTLTETRPEVEVATPQAEPGPVRESVFASADHKRIGLLQLAAGLLHLAIGAVLLAVARAGGADLGIGDLLAARASSAETTFLYLAGLPVAWLGLATIVVPLQIGATRLALPRLHAASTWTVIAGGLVAAAGYIAGSSRALDFDSPFAPVIREGGASTGTELVITGVALLAFALLLQAVSLVATIVTERAEGMTLSRAPMFTVATLVSAIVLVLALPAFLAGLAILGVDHHFGGAFFAEQNLAGARVWQHLLFLPGWPMLTLLALPALGAMSDIVAGHARRSLLVQPAVAGALVAYGAFTLLSWAAGRERLLAVTQPIHSVPLVLLAAPIGVCVLLWLGTLRFGKVHAHVSLLGPVLFLLLVGAGAAGAVVAAVGGVEADGARTFARGTLTLLVLGPASVALVAAVAHWAPKITGRSVAPAAAGVALLLTLTGALVAAVPDWVVGLDNSQDLLIAGAVGGGVLALGYLAALASLRSGDRAPDNPYGAGTLEWATASPPPPHNFDTLPEVRSSSPMHDLDTTGAR